MSAPIGVFDSGVGGLSVLREIRRLLPGEDLLYVADSGHVPYGEKPPEAIRERSMRIAEFLIAQGARALVLACNTATAAAVNELRSTFDMPIIGMEPAVKPAAAVTRNGKVGVLATTGTLQSAKFAALLDRFARDVQVLTQPCPGLVECVERGDLQGPEVRVLLQTYLAPLMQAGCDTVILGCTHYPFLKPLLRELLPEDIQLVDTGEAVARQLQARLLESSVVAAGEGRERFWSSADPQHMAAVLPVLWGARGDVDTLPV
ncbi:glutamate racemase [Halopseudomonas oceani]|uniref:glutamate racemase n=1 Tax=Halopseudomonas oceani TaxID=1708783 RepID=UPI002AA67DA6|nr:glutamate racemase [Halopseudomonas oceani]